MIKCHERKNSLFENLGRQNVHENCEYGKKKGLCWVGGARSSVIRAINRENIPPRDKMGKCPYDVIVDYGFSPDFMKTS